MKLIVWDLFGGGQNSVYHGLQEAGLLNRFVVFTFDLAPPTRPLQFQVDLASDNLIEYFNQFPKPDIIVASPLCQSFSQALKMKGGGTCFWKYNDTKTKIILRSVDEFNQLKAGFTKNLDATVQLNRALLGQQCLLNTIKLIHHFNPKVWYIENPASSLMWEYLKLNTDLKGYSNLAYYNKYGHPVPKPTVFYSNIQMQFKDKDPIKINNTHIEVDTNGIEWEVNNDYPEIRIRRQLQSRIRSLSLTKKILKANAKSNVEESGVESKIPPALIQTIFHYFDIAITTNSIDGEKLFDNYIQHKLF